MAFLFCTLSFNKAHATHASGSDLQYTWISGNTFQVTVSFYRDCAGVAAPTSISLNAKSTNCNKNQNYTLNLVAGTGQEITFPCYTVQTKCTSGSSPYAGYQQYRYANTVTLPQQCTDWVLNYYVCCRNCAITTLSNPCNDNMYIEATLNNVAAPTNSSPQFTNIPVAFLCVNQNFTYNHGVIDPNGDSLVYSFITPETFNTATNTTGTVTFNSGYSANSPLTSSPAVAINSSNGDITMHPTVNGEIGVTAILIKEYRNGVLIGSVIRDMQFLTKVCNPNFLPVASGINGTAVFDVVACPGFNISFTVNSSDPNAGDTVKMTWNNVIAAATFNTTNNILPVGTFSWTPTLADARSQPYTFTVTVRDNACPTNGSQTYSYRITVPIITATVSSPTFSGFNIACRGGATGSITATPGGGTAPYTYLWNPSSQTTQTATALTANTYIVTVTDSKGCTKTASTTLTQPASVTSISVSGTTNVSCNGGNNGTATVFGSGGVLPYSYLWTPTGQTTATATSLSAVVYTARVTDANGCTAQQAIAISQPSVLNGSISTFTNVTCQGNANGKITATASGGTGPYTHHWSNNATTAAITGLAPGTYTDTIRDSKGCIKLVSQAISQPGSAVSIPTGSISRTNVNCFGQSNGVLNINPTGGTPSYTVTWSNGDIGNTADSLAAGTYTVHIVDGNLCTFDTSLTITQPVVLSATFTNFSTSPSGTNIRCNGDTTGRVKIVPAGGTGPYTYLWNTGATLDSIKNRPAGVYFVRITDSHGCTRTDTTTLTQPTLLRDSLKVRHVGCKGEPSGGVRIVAYGGSPTYTYVWTPPLSTTDTLKNLFAGFYSVIVTDLNGCTKSDTITIQEPDTLVPLILPSTYIGAINVACNGDSSGSAVVNVFGGTRPFTYTWSQNSTDSFATNLGAGIVSVHVVDSNGCSITRDTVLNQPPPFSYAPVTRDPLCFGDSSGYIVLHTGGSVGPYTFTWSNGGSTDSLGHLTTGAFTVYVKDANNCRDTLGFTLNNPDTITAFATLSSYQGFNNRCNGDSSAFIALHPQGGNGVYTYSWSNSSTSDSISHLANGTYSVTILDGNGCRQDTAITLTQPALINPVINPSIYNGGGNVSCNGFIDGAAHSTVTGGIPPYHYLWSNGDVADSALGLGVGPHSLMVTDSNGCSVTTPFTFTEPTPVSMTATLSNFNGFNISCYGDSNACVTINVNGGNGPYLYVWDIQDTISDSTLCNLPADTFAVRVLDANGCQLDTAFILTSPAPFNFNPVLSSYNGYEIQCHGFSNGNIDLSTAGGVAPFQFAWSPTSDTTEDLTNIVAGTYSVLITDANNCVDSATFVLNEPPAITANLSMNGATCSLNNGSAQVNVTGGLTPFSYLWSPDGDTTATLAAVPAGWHTITITDSVGCLHVDSIYVVTIPTIGPGFASQVNNVCPGDMEGSVQVTTSGGTSPFSYVWNNGDTTATADSLPAGYASVLITDGAGCIETDSVLITEPAAFVANYNVTNAFCSGRDNGSATITLNGGNGPYSFTWSNGDTGNTADSLGGGYAVVNFTDANGCPGIDSVNIVQNSTILSAVAAQVDVDCNGSNDGIVTVNPATGGAPPYSYVWTNGDTGITADGLSGGVVSVTITDANNCFVTNNYTIIEPPALIATAEIQQISCGGVNDGSALAKISGGTPGYIYGWSNSVVDTIIQNLAAGIYIFTVTDAHNCVDTAQAVIAEDDCELELPSGFSPNGDGFNDTYVIHGLGRYPNNIFTVFNRWGNEVYKVDDYRNQWTGSNKSAEELPEGTYFVTFEVKGEDIRKNTFVDIRRGK